MKTETRLYDDGTEPDVITKCRIYTDEALLADLNPTGNLKVGELITVYYYGPTPAIPSPSAPTLSPPSPGNSVTAGATYGIAWTAVSCPTGLNLVSYTIRGAQESPINVAAGETSYSSLTAPNSPGMSLSITVEATCGTLTSSPSAPLTVTIN